MVVWVKLPPLRRGDRAAEGAALEMLCTPKGYRGFESHPLRHKFYLSH